MPRPTPRTMAAVLTLCAVMALVPAPRADRGAPVIKWAPETTVKRVVAPVATHAAAARDDPWCDDQGNVTVAFEFEGGFRLEQRFPTSRGTGQGILLALGYPDGSRKEWKLSPGFLDDLGRASAELLQRQAGLPVDARTGGRQSLEALAGEVARSLLAADGAALEELEAALLPVGHEAIGRGLETAVLALADSAGPAKDGDQCYGTIGKTFLSLAGTVGCFMSAPVTLGAHGVLCFGLAVGTGSFAAKALTSCGGGGDGCTCWPVKYCMCCSLAEGESCACRCEGPYREPCCDWEQAVSPLPVGDESPDPGQRTVRAGAR